VFIVVLWIVIQTAAQQSQRCPSAPAAGTVCTVGGFAGSNSPRFPEDSSRSPP
jgi:hypothetical protein